MAIYELKTFHITCDRCDASYDYAATNKWPLPNGWGVMQIGPCGMTDYFRDGHECPACAAQSRAGTDGTEES